MLQTKICLECKQVFTPRSAIQKYCNRDHYRICKICGNQFLVPRDKLSYPNAVCSKECQYRGLSSGAFLSDAPIRTCEACGREFKPHSPNQRFCNNDHFLTCIICGKEFKAEHWQLVNKTPTCSIKCGAKLSHQTYQEKYNSENNPEAHAQLIAKQERTMKAKYGVSNALNRDGRQLFKVEEKFEQKYGVRFPGLSPEINEKRITTTLERWGTTCSLTNPEIAAKSKKTLLAKYGVDNYAKSTEFLKQVITEPDKADMCRAFRDNPRQFILDNFPDRSPTLGELSKKCGIKESSVGWILDLADCHDIISYTYSKMEDEVYSFLIKELGTDLKIERNTFKIITPYELDLFLPDYNFAIECDPTVTHNSTLPGWSSNDEPKSTTYHKLKTDLCENKGIFLYHIFGYDWSHHREVVESMLRNVIKTTPSRIFARKTILKQVSDHDAMNFLNTNHRQGGAHSKIRIGLYENDELVSLMTFSKMRPTIGTGKENLVDCYELVRFCNKLNTNVIGGASKLFNYFINTFDPYEVRSFSDRAHTKGSLYTTLGFTYDHTTDPGYMWVDLKTDQGFARNNAQKSNIKKFLKDDSIDLTKTEVQIMAEHNYVQVFDSGVKLWIWRRADAKINT